MLSVLASIAVDCGCEHALVKAKTIKLVFAASPLRIYHVEVRSERMINRSMKIQIYFFYYDAMRLGCYFLSFVWEEYFMYHRPQ